MWQIIRNCPASSSGNLRMGQTIYQGEWSQRMKHGEGWYHFWQEPALVSWPILSRGRSQQPSSHQPAFAAGFFWMRQSLG